MALPEAGDEARGWARFRELHLFDYNAKARRFWCALALAGFGCVAWALVGVAARPVAELWRVLAWLTLVAVAAAFPITIPRSKHSISSGDILTYLLLALHGAPVAVLAAGLEGAVGAWRTSRRLTSRVATVAAAAIGMSLGGSLFESAEGMLAIAGAAPAAAHVAALTLAAAPYFCFSTALLMQVICLKSGVPLRWRDWFENGSWVGTLHLLSAVLAAMLSLNAQRFGQAPVTVAVLVMGVSLTLLRAHFRQQIAGHEAQEARVNAAQLESLQAQKRFHAAFSQASIGMAIVNTEGQVLQANQALQALLGYAEPALLGRVFRDLLHPGDATLLDRHTAEVMARGREQLSIELRCIDAQSREIWVSLHYTLFDSGGDGETAGLIFQLHDITSRRHAEGKLRHIAFHDSLTDLANRNCFQEQLAGAVERYRSEPGRPFAVMLLDLDRFKIVNDSLGHPAGDELLKEVARRLRASVRPSDLVARLGGDEFAILLEDAIQVSDAVALGERLLLALGQPININGTDLRPQASIGLTFSDTGARTPDEVLRDADLAMYQAKSGGKGRLALFDPSLHDKLGHKLQLEADLRQAIGDGQLSLAYQPLFELQPYRLAGFEALARWSHPVRGTISPGVFIALAEESGCIEALTAWAIDEAVRQHAAWLREMPEHGRLVMHVNVSGKDLSQPLFVSHVLEVLRRYGMPPPLLVLEITESTLMEHRETALEALQTLCDAGVKVGIDDFGTGYSSLAYLSTLPFDCLKIDRSFVIGLKKSPQNVEIVRTIVSLGRTLNKQVVAEGIETHDQLRQLRELGATIGQGYLLSRPLSPARAHEMLAGPLLVAS